MSSDSVCRTCEGDDNLRSIFINNDETISLKLMTCANIQVLKDDGLPQDICLSCVDELNSAFNFKQRCENIDYKLREVIFNVKVELEESNPLELILVKDFEIKSELMCERQGDYAFADEDDAQDTIPAKPDKSKSTSRKRTKGRQAQKTKPQRKKVKYVAKLKNYMCTGCDDTFPSYSLLAKHRKVHGNRKYLCRICNTQWFKSNSALKLHQNIHKNVEESDSFECHLCQRKYTNRNNLSRHMRTHTNDKRYKCDICKKTFIQSNSLKEHKLTHSTERDFACVHCNKAYKSQRYLERHRELAHQEFVETALACPICAGMYRTERTLQWHLKQQHERDSADVIVQEIKQSIKALSITERRELYKSKQNTIAAVCNYCGKGFKKVAEMNIHKRKHTGEKPYECKVCSKRFTYTGDFKAHMNYHMGIRPFLCTICNKNFSQGTHLKHHMLIHTGERPHTCNFCGKAFRLKSNLRIHIRIHTGERPYKCNGCEMSFGDLNGLKRHVKKHENSALE